jgi:N-acetylmuramic acid 6-phosphate etherase
VAFIAGGDGALRTAVEGAEDDPDGGSADIRSAGVTGTDVVVGVSASGRTPYVEGAVREAGRRGARTALVTAADPGTCTVRADVVVALPVGAEVIAGSTRMKAGTATKMVLNMISTGAMVLSGRVYRNMMVDLRPNSAKLKRRAVRIVSEAAGVDEQTASELVDDVNGRAKLAVVMARTGLDKDAAQRLLDKEQGFVYRVIEQTDSEDQIRPVSGRPDKEMEQDGRMRDRSDAGSVDYVAGVQSDTAEPADRGDDVVR